MKEIYNQCMEFEVFCLLSKLYIWVNRTELFKLLTPNVNYSGRTAPLTSKMIFYIIIQQIYALNILNTVYIYRFFLFKMQFVS